MWYARLLERDLLPDPMIRWGIRRLLGQRLAGEYAAGPVSGQKEKFVEMLRASPVAIDTRAANEQHYEVPTAFFRHVLGPQMKYSSGLWPDGSTDLAASECAMLELSAQRARLELRRLESGRTPALRPRRKRREHDHCYADERHRRVACQALHGSCLHSEPVDRAACPLHADEHITAKP